MRRPQEFDIFSTLSQHEAVGLYFAGETSVKHELESSASGFAKKSEREGRCQKVLSIEMFVIKRKKQYLFNQMIYGKDVAPCCQHPSLTVIPMQLTQATQVAERLC